MNSFVLSPEAEEDIFEVWTYLANEVNVEFANQIESNLFDAFALLSRNLPAKDSAGDRCPTARQTKRKENSRESGNPLARVSLL